MKKLFSVTHNAQTVDVALLIGRIGITLLMLTHGLPKIAGLSASPVKFINLLGLGATFTLILAVLAEVGCSILVLIGLGTRLAIIPLIITMLVAVFYVHSEDPFAKQEMGLHYILGYTLLFILGSGKYSVDSLLFKRKNTIS